MITTIIVLSLIGCGYFWAYRTGKKVQSLDEIKRGMENLETIHEFDKEIDAQTRNQVNNSGDNPVVGPWLRDRK
tara:strand:+ start:346 stop:567 length:222 start_codon:yes stop_codon:yes gene_type:complete